MKLLAVPLFSNPKTFPGFQPGSVNILNILQISLIIADSSEFLGTNLNLRLKFLMSILSNKSSTFGFKTAPEILPKISLFDILSPVIFVIAF